MLSEQLVKAGIDTEVYATTANGEKELPVTPNKSVDVDGVTVTYFKRLTKDHSHYSPALVKKVWKEVSNFDIVHIHAWWNLVSLMSCAAALIRKVPVLLSPRGTLSAYSFSNKNIGLKQVIHTVFGKTLLSRCAINVTSQNESEAVKALIHPKNIAVLPNFVKLPERQTYPEKAAFTVFKLLFFSRIEEKKGLDLLIRALATITVSFKLTIAGNGNETYINALKSLALENNVSDKIDWVGFQNEGKFDLLQQHDLLVLPSNDENFGNVVIESLSVGTPVLISDKVGLADYVIENKLGWICTTNPASISGMINIIANDQAGLCRIRTSAPAIIYNDFNEDNLVKKYITMYHQLINNG